MTPHEREEKTLFRARFVFRETGSLVTYNNASGQQMLYAPSEKEIRDRQELRELSIKTRTILEFTRIQLRAQIWVALIALVVAIGWGFIARAYGATSQGAAP
jgi:hypothetical protein